jgi:hypothetical protein
MGTGSTMFLPKKDARTQRAYTILLALVAAGCAAYLVVLVATRHPMFLVGDAPALPDKLLFAAYAACIILFASLCAGLARLWNAAHTGMLVGSAAGTLLLAGMFVLGIWHGGLVAAAEWFIATLLQPAGIAGADLSTDVVLLVWPIVILFNPFNLWLFAKDPTLKGLFVAAQPAAPALHRREL